MNSLMLAAFIEFATEPNFNARYINKRIVDIRNMDMDDSIKMLLIESYKTHLDSLNLLNPKP